MPASKGASWKPAEDMILRKYLPTRTVRMLMALLPGRTRNAIIGRAHRTKVKIGGPEGGMPVGLPAAMQWLPDKDKVRPMPRKRERPRRTAPKPPAQLPTDVWSPLVGTKPVALVDAEQEHCRWPIGKTFIGYCGCQRELENTPYCATHLRIAVVRSSRQW